MDTNETQARFFKALTHPVRLAILNILRDGEQCVCHLEAFLGLRQAYISQQLAVLREAGLVQDRRDGWNIFYQVVQPEVYGLLDLAARLSSGEAGVGPELSVASESLASESLASESVASQSVECPCPKCQPSREKLADYQPGMEEKC